MFRAVFCVVILLLAASLRAELVPLDAPPGSGSLAPGLASLDDGRAVLTWLEPDGDGHAFRFSLFDGESFGDAYTIARGKDWFANWADTPGLFVLPNGDWLAHWLVKSGPATFAYDVVMARSQDEGKSWNEPKIPHRDGTRTEHGFVSYFAWDEDVAGAVWLDGRETAVGEGSDHAGHHDHAGDMTLRAARIGPDLRVSDKQLLDGRVCDCCMTASSMTDEGPLVIYRGRSDDEIRDIWKVYHDGEAWSEPELLHADGWQIGGCPVNGPALIADRTAVVAAWFTMPENTPQVRLAISRDSGKEFSIQPAVGKGSALGRVSLAWIGEGFVLAWLNQDSSGAGLVLTAYSLSGEKRWEREVVAMDAGRISGFPRLATLGPDSLLLSWTAPGPERKPRVNAAIVRVSR